MSDLHGRLSAVLAGIAARADAAAQPEPWDDQTVARNQRLADAEFIAAARASVARTAAALTATLAEHPPTVVHLDDADDDTETVCATCIADDDTETDGSVPMELVGGEYVAVPLWPCRTVRLIADALGVDVTG